MLKHFTINKFHDFIKQHEIIQGSIMFIIGGLFSGVIKKFNEQVLRPVVTLDFENLKKANYKEFLNDVIELVITTYIMFAFFKLVHIADL